jgi:predicted phage terminase large subunit-like protein
MHGTKQKPLEAYTTVDVDVYAALAEAEAREHFGAYRQFIRPTMKWDWFTAVMADELDKFYQRLVLGHRPKLAIMAPPQHGKSMAAEDLVSYLAGKAPFLKTIYASYSEALGARTNLGVQRTMMSDRYKRVFRTDIDQQGWMRNTSLIEYAYQTGSFRNTTVQGAINGQELHFGLIDDPMKGRAEANSFDIRNKTWDWFTDDFGARFASNSGMLWIMTRWHVDDPLGRLLELDKSVRVLKFKAIAEKDERYRKKGEALFPGLKPLDFLLERKKIMSAASWEAEYQQEPYVVGGGMFPIDKILIIPVFDRSQIVSSILAVDKAGTKDAGAYTAIVLMHKLKSGQFLIETVLRGRWGSLEREQVIYNAAHAAMLSLSKYTQDFKIVIEQEPGSGGKESAEATIRNLAGFTCIADKVTGAKEIRAEPFAAQVQGSNVLLVAGPWIKDFLAELESWPFGKTLDQGDAAAMAFQHHTMGPIYDHSYAGFQ